MFAPEGILLKLIMHIIGILALFDLSNKTHHNKLNKSLKVNCSGKSIPGFY